MTRIRQLLGRKWARLPIFLWLVIAFCVLVGIAIYSFFFVRREVLHFRPTHTFAVEDGEFFGSAHALGDPLPLAGNRVQLLHNGDQIFPAMLKAIREAKKSVNFEAFLFESGSIGNQFRDAFIERAHAGVHVRVLLDGIGSGVHLNNSDVQAMKDGGCEFFYFHPTHSWRLDRINRRSHRRVLVVDGHVGFTGGVGFSDRWSGNADSPDHWRDVHARLEGPIVAKLQGAFQQHWVESSGKVIEGADEFPALPALGPLRGQMTASHAFSFAPMPLTQAVAVAAATRRISITNAYCTPSDDQVALLLEAVKRGVNVRLLLPGKHTDQPMTRAAGRTAYGKLLEGGVKIFEYQPTMIHTKTMVVDGLFSIFGSSNLDARSSAINEELDISIYDKDFGRDMETVFEKDLNQSRPYTLEDFKRRSTWDRVSEAFMEPFHSQL